MFKLVLLLLATLAASFVAAETAYFAFETFSGGGEFIFQLTDDKRIAEARNILNGGETEKIHVIGRISKNTQSYNPRYSFNLIPETISFFDQAIEICDAHLTYVEDHIDEVCGAFLPGCMYCPWSSKLTREVKV